MPLSTFLLSGSKCFKLFLVQVSCTWTEFEVVAWQCDEVWSRKVNQDSSDLKGIVFSLIQSHNDCFQSHSVIVFSLILFRSMVQLRLQTQYDELKSTLPLLFCKYQTLGVTIRSSED